MAPQFPATSPIAQVTRSLRLKIPVEHARLAELVCRLHLQAHQALELRPATVLKLFEQLDAFRKPDRLENFLLACEADKRSRLGHADTPYPQAEYLRGGFAAARAIAAQAIVEAGLEGPAIAEAQRQSPIKAIAEMRA